MFNIGGKVTINAAVCTVVSIEINKRGKAMVTATRPDGRTVKVDARMVDAMLEFAPAERWADIIRQGKREDRARALRNIGAR